MMKLFTTLAFLLMTLSTVYGLRCYTCTAAQQRSCTDSKSCPVFFNRCYSFKVDGYDMVTKGCQSSLVCGGTMQCCEGDLCNNSKHITPSFILLLVASSILALFF